MIVWAVLVISAVCTAVRAEELIEVDLNRPDDSLNPLSFLSSEAIDGLTDETLLQRGLIKWEKPPKAEAAAAAGSADASKFDYKSQLLTGSSVLANHKMFNRDVSTRQFHNPTLGYVTPWNGRGYELSRVFARRLDYVAPVWYQIEFTTQPTPAGRQQQTKPKFHITVKGRHDVHRTWMADVRRISATGHVTRIVPRFTIAGSPELWARFVVSPKLHALFMKRIMAEIDQFQFDGVVLECVDAWAKVGTGVQLRSKLNQFMRFVAESLHAVKPKPRELILVIPPTRGSGKNTQKTATDTDPLFGPNDFAALHSVVDRFSLMTYDYSTGNNRAGPNAPFAWIEYCLQQLFSANPKFVHDKSVTSRVLMGVPFYGYSFSRSEAKAVVAHDIIKILKATGGDFYFDPSSIEHFIRYRDPNAKPASTPPPKDGTDPNEFLVFYPSLHFLDARIQLAKKYGVCTAGGRMHFTPSLD